MSQVNNELKYTKSHEWVRVEADGSMVIGISDHAQSLLGDVVFVELPEIDAEYDAGTEVGVIESVKAAADAYNPIAGRVLAVNEALLDSPELINESPFDDGWMYRLAPHSAADLDGLMNAEAYAALLAEEE
ncbi:Glycine cleavage system H protein [Piscirickettsia salmonis]|uniref:Glycine cleavage system H protein n=1 Tax=Piscirickettsia salmonis TaxID=1238 RepID=A0A1L6TDN3_PISSA|nr:glycine cleavage system protein GcvH [Piscirickettsia salmonis]AKP74547.1 glycine cleavage system protein H [Piscirickettsia salmonis LF-89 = ATCC VR-1361]ALB23536.1 glycine cleavage system H protein [Piscirickettsia salmonis]ALY03409.1 glycine cleavage system protein H [Piscirickettsia salmonis]AMA42973.1 glycine cleavage system protein H [Piscirickettsia salmonis]AOS35443.1 glycine cleavage system protein H [Piscirickettsia salmonis]